MARAAAGPHRAREGARRGVARRPRAAATSYEVLINLQAAPGRRRRMAELADGVLLSRSGMTRLVDRLEREGLLERDPCTDDGRGMFAVLTDKGDALLLHARPTHLDGVRERFLRHFEPDELRALAELWKRVLPGSADLSRPTKKLDSLHD